MVYAENVIKKLKKILKKFSSSEERVRATSLLGLLLIITAIPVTVYVAQMQQDIRQRANSFQLRSIDVNACGEIISSPAVGAGTGDIRFRAPVKGPDGKWQTVKMDGSIKTEDEMRVRYLADPRNGGTIDERERNIQSAIGENYINCNVFINSGNNLDCDVLFQQQLPNGSDNGKLPPGGETILHLAPGSNSGAGCRKLVKVEVDPAAPTPTTPAGTTPTVAPTVVTPTTVGASPTPTKTPTPTPSQAAPTATPVPTLAVTPTMPKTPTQFSVSLLAPGIGKNGNETPNNITRTITFQLFDSASKQIGSDVVGRVSYDSESGLFKGTINMGTIVQTASYIPWVKMNQFLKTTKAAETTGGANIMPISQFPWSATRIPITAGITNILPQITLVSGDINNDNKIDILDYNILVSCFTSKAVSDGCAGKQIDSDLNDNGIVDGADYNLFLRGVKAGGKLSK